MDALIVYYEYEVEALRARVSRQNSEILGLTQQLVLRYRLYAELEDELNLCKNEYEQFKTDCIHRHQQNEPPSPPDLELEPRETEF